MEAFQLPIIIVLGFILLVFFIELKGKDKTIERNEVWMKRYRKRIKKQEEVIESYRSRQARFSKWMSKDELKEAKGWSESQFTTMMWALKKEGYAKTKGKHRHVKYCIVEKGQ